MGGVVSTGQDNDDLIDNLKEAEYIKSTKVEQVFRIVDRAHYYLPGSRESAYKDLAWKSGTLHLSAPCIYSEVMEALELKEGLSFLNIGSGTGYLNTMVGFMIGPYGINHGIELHLENVEYAEERLREFIQIAKKFDDLEFCEPVFVQGNCLNLAPDNRKYDRVYCGAACPPDLKSTVQNLMKLNGILVMPVGDQLLKVKRTSETEFTAENVLPVSFASLYVPPTKDVDVIVMPEVNPVSLQNQCAVVIRTAIRKKFCFDTPSKDTSKDSKMERSNKLFQQDSVRLPLNFLPAAQRLMIMSAFGQSDESINSDADDQTDESYLDLQLQRYAQEVQRVGWRARQERRQENIEDIDSSLSDDEMSILEEEQEKDSLTESSKDPLKSVSEDIESMESEDGIVADDEQEEDDERESGAMALSGGVSSNNTQRKRSSLSVKTNKTSVKSKGDTASVNNLSVVDSNRDSSTLASTSAPKGKGPNKSYLCLSSDEDDALVTDTCLTDPIQVATFSHPRRCKTSYSTSAEASETSGFGSLGDDTFQIGSLPSSSVFLNNEEDDITDENSCGAGVFSHEHDDDEMSVKSQSSKMTKSKSVKDGNGVIPEEKVDKKIRSNEESDEQFVDDHDTSTDEEDISSSEEESCEKRKKQALFESRGPDFTAFLKTQVNTLPIPNSLKLFILRYR